MHPHAAAAGRPAPGVARFRLVLWQVLVLWPPFCRTSEPVWQALTGCWLAQAHEALRRAKFKFPGRQKIVDSRNWCAFPLVAISCSPVCPWCTCLVQAALGSPACCTCRVHSMDGWVSGGELSPGMSMLLCRGFTRFSRDDYIQWKKEGRLVNDGVNAKVGHWVC